MWELRCRASQLAGYNHGFYSAETGEKLSSRHVRCIRTASQKSGISMSTRRNMTDGFLIQSAKDDPISPSKHAAPISNSLSMYRAISRPVRARQARYGAASLICRIWQPHGRPQAPRHLGIVDVADIIEGNVSTLSHRLALGDSECSILETLECTL